MSELFEFLPVPKENMESRGRRYDFPIVTGDAYVDHSRSGPAAIARVPEAEGFRVTALAQPDWHSADAFLAVGRPRRGGRGRIINRAGRRQNQRKMPVRAKAGGK